MKAIFNPNEARRFADWLDEEMQELSSDLGRTNLQMSRLNESWNDAKFIKYHESFDQDLKQLARFFDLAEGFTVFLRKQADIIESYLAE